VWLFAVILSLPGPLWAPASIIEVDGGMVWCKGPMYGATTGDAFFTCELVLCFFLNVSVHVLMLIKVRKYQPALLQT
jgi:hypothetical protein